jgi:hypothetical protein
MTEVALWLFAVGLRMWALTTVLWLRDEDTEPAPELMVLNLRLWGCFCN